jgi:hypothetical protein
MYQYRVRIRKKSFLWGGSQVTSNLHVASASPTDSGITNTPLFLTIRVDDAEEVVAIGQAHFDPAGAFKERSLGTLAGGQSYTLILNSLCGVFAEPNKDVAAWLTCVVHSNQ